MGAIVGLLLIVLLIFGLMMFVAGLVGLIITAHSRRKQSEKINIILFIVFSLSLVIGIIMTIPGGLLAAQIIQSEIYNAQYSQTIEYAADINDYDGVKKLLENGVNPDECFSNGTYTPLMHACTGSDCYDIAKLLLEYKANPNLEYDGYPEGEEIDYTALMYAVSEPENLNLVRLLVEYGADINHTAADGETPLTRAEYFENWGVVNYLKSIGAEFALY